MKTHIARRFHAAAFTLIELLVVITIIAILTGLSMSAYNIAIKNAHNVQARNSVMQVALALQNYHSEYGRLPIRSAGTDRSIDLDGSNSLLDVLLGQNPDQLNPGAHRYIEPSMATSGANGLIANGDSFGLTDPWGQPLVVVLDSNGDNKIANPDAENGDATIAKDASPFLPRQVAVYSLGRDKKEHTQDDIVSWR